MQQSGGLLLASAKLPADSRGEYNLALCALEKQSKRAIRQEKEELVRDNPANL